MPTNYIFTCKYAWNLWTTTKNGGVIHSPIPNDVEALQLNMDVGRSKGIINKARIALFYVTIDQILTKYNTEQNTIYHSAQISQKYNKPDSTTNS